MSDHAQAAAREPRRGREARRSARAKASLASIPYITRKIPLTELVSEEGLDMIERNAETLLEEIGIEFRDFPRALALFRDAGCDIKGERVRFPRGLARRLCATTPAQYVQHARNPERNVKIGGDAMVFAPNYGSPFVHDLDKGRRYGTLEDFQNFVKLAYLSPFIHHSGGTVCEPVDLPVNKRHFEMVYAHLKYSDKPFMGSVTKPERAEDSVRICELLFGEAFVRDNTVMTSLINANSPLVWDFEHARRGGGLCAREPGLHHHALHPVWRDEPGDGRRHPDPGAGRSHGGDGVLPAHQARRAGGVRDLRLHPFHAVRRADLRHARGGAGDLRRGPARAADEHAVPHRRLALRLEDPGRAGGLRERPDPSADGAGWGQFRPARRRLARGRPYRIL